MSKQTQYNYSARSNRLRPIRRSPIAGRPRGQAGIFTAAQITCVEKYIENQSLAPHSDRLKFYLTIYAGLRIGEVCEIYLADLVNKDGSISDFVRVRARIAKGNRERLVPMHPKIRSAVRQFMLHHPGVPYVAFSHRSSQPKKQSLTALTNYMARLYILAGVSGCSSHSGRRTFITNLARSMNGTDFTLRDVQALAGHSRLDTTEKYIGMGERLESLIGRLK